jgi:phospholipase/carboxylesterase
MHTKNIVSAGKKLSEAKKALIMLHGRGATAQDILTLSSHLNVDDFALLAPQASNFTWYPYSFLMKPSENEPWLTSALNLIAELVEDVKKAGISPQNIYFAGFSQGACLTLEFVTRNAQRWGGVAAFTGGLIGDKVYEENYRGDFNSCPIYIGTSDPDPHVPVERVNKSLEILRRMNANVSVDVFPNMGHTITLDEIENANAHVFS